MSDAQGMTRGQLIATMLYWIASGATVGFFVRVIAETFRKRR